MVNVWTLKIFEEKRTQRFHNLSIDHWIAHVHTKTWYVGDENSMKDHDHGHQYILSPIFITDIEPDDRSSIRKLFRTFLKCLRHYACTSALSSVRDKLRLINVTPFLWLFSNKMKCFWTRLVIDSTIIE